MNAATNRAKASARPSPVFFAKSSLAILGAVSILTLSDGALACGGPSDGEIVVVLAIVLSTIGFLLTGMGLGIYGLVRLARRRNAKNAVIIV